MNQDITNKVKCPRCGNEIDVNSRYCLQCGCLNPINPINKGMKKFIEKNKENSYQVGDGQVIMKNSNQITNSIGNNTGNKMICFLVNYLLYISIIIFSFLSIVGSNITDFVTIKNSTFPYISFTVSIIFLYVYSMELIFMKANKRWWYALVPFYNLFILADIVYKKKWLGIILLIPGIGQIFFIVTLYILAGKFRCNGLLTILLPFIFIPLMGFGSRLYENINYITEDKTLEKDYKRKKFFFISIVIFLLLGLVFILWNNIVDIKNKSFRLRNYYYVYATKQIVNKTKQLANENYLECDKPYKDGRGKYYIEYGDIGDVAYIPFHLYRDIISGYVIIDNTSGSSKYYISISDGTYGYPETLYEDVNVDSVVPYTEIVTRKDINNCINTKPKATVGGLK